MLIPMNGYVAVVATDVLVKEMALGPWGIYVSIE
jgi:hypothetical protein